MYLPISKKSGFIVCMAITLMLSLNSCATTQARTSPSTGPQENTAIQTDSNLSSKTPYPYKETTSTAIPQGYTLSFIESVGRHGSRNLSAAKYDKTLYELLQIAQSQQEITPEGITLYHEIGQLMDEEKGKYGLITEKGKKELEGIGERTGINYHALFAQKSTVITYATYKDRVKASRDAFLSGLQKEVPHISYVSNSYEKGEDPFLRPYDIAPAYQAFKEDGAWQKIYTPYASKGIGAQYNKQVMLQFITPSFYDQIEKGTFQLKDDKGRVKLKNPTQAALNLYNLYIISPALNGNYDFGRYFTTEQRAWYESILSLEDYFQKGPSISPLPTNIIAPLVAHMINDADINISNQSHIGGIFSFAHAETLIPLQSFLDIEGSNQSSTNPHNIMQSWDASIITPMAANIMWVFYSKGDQVLVKMLRNEKEIAFPCATDNYPYYQWDEVRNYYTNKIQSLGFAVNESLATAQSILATQY